MTRTFHQDTSSRSLGPIKDFAPWESPSNIAPSTAAMKQWAYAAAAALAVQIALPVQAVSITDIQGPAFISPLNGQTVNNLTGIVTAKVCLTSRLRLRSNTAQ